MDNREELVVLMLAMTRREYAGLTSLQARRGEVSLLELVRSLVLQALLEESIKEVERRKDVLDGAAAREDRQDALASLDEAARRKALDWEKKAALFNAQALERAKASRTQGTHDDE